LIEPFRKVFDSERYIALSCKLLRLQYNFKIRKAFVTLFSSAIAFQSQVTTDGTAILMAHHPIRVRPSKARGYADHGWLKSYHTFSFANYYDHEFEQFGPLRVINEDTVAGGQGFGTHPHQNAEIFSYILSGSLSHHDSMGNKEVLNRGDIQFTSAGTGIRHSEFNARKDIDVRFLQIWALPNRSGLTPNYQTKTFPDEAKIDKLLTVLTPTGKNETIKINQDFNMYASLLTSGASVTLDLGKRRSYIHLPILTESTGVELSGKLFSTGSDIPKVLLNPGDGAFIEGVQQLEIRGRQNAPNKKTELVLFDFL
jgi:quercetin 2,3-dioxygenase